jgi:hypothetical protein
MKVKPLTPLSCDEAIREMRGRPVTPAAPAPQSVMEERLWHLLLAAQDREERAKNETEHWKNRFVQERDRFKAYRMRGKFKYLSRELIEKGRQ